MNAAALIGALVGHLIGDYLIQNDWMALNKKSKTTLGVVTVNVHAILWAAAVCTLAGWWHMGVPLSTSAAWVFPVLYITHVVQDHTNVVAWWMDAIGQKAFRTGPCAPWSSIVVDNVWHIVTIYAVWRFLA